MPEHKTRFIPKQQGYQSPIEVPHTSNRVPYYGTGLSRDVRLTNIGPVNTELYSPSLRSYSQHNDSEVTKSGLQMRADQLTSRLEEVKRVELENELADDDNKSETSSRWQCRDTRIKYTGSLDRARRDYFELEDIDHRTDIMKPTDGSTAVTTPLNGYCYLCTTQEEHRQHLRSEKKVKGQPLKQYTNPIKPDTLPSRPFSASTPQSHDNHPQGKAIYKVLVKTGNQHNCGTDAEVTLRMYGLSPKERTGKLPLRKPASRFMFMRDSAHTFSITAPNYKQISSIEIETDGYETNQSWFLDYVEITNMKTKAKYYFPCSDWLSLYHKGETLVRKLTPMEKEEVFRDYEVTVVTGGHKHSGIDSKVYLTLIGAQGRRSLKQHLCHKDESHCFRRGAVDSFKLRSKDIGALSKIRIEHDNKGKSRRWLLLLVFIKDLYNKRQHLFFCNQWLVNEENNAVWREIPTSKVPKGFNIGSWGGSKEEGGDVLYEINVHTGDVGFAGTDATIYIQLQGDKSNSKSINLSEIRGNYENPFEKNQTDIFQVKLPNVGELKKIRVGHDGQGMAAGWYLEKILVRKFTDVRTRVAVEDEKDKETRKKRTLTTASAIGDSDDESLSESSDERTDSESDTESEDKTPLVIGRNFTRSASIVSTKEKKKREKSRSSDKKKGVDRDSDRSSDTASLIHSITASQLRSNNSDSDKDIDETELSDSDEEQSTTRGRRGDDLKQRKKTKEDKRRRRMDNLSDVAEISEDSSAATSVWDSDGMPTVDDQIQEALRLKQKHDKLTKTMEKVVPMVEEYLFICKQWFAEDEGDGKTERILKVSETKTYNRR